MRKWVIGHGLELCWLHCQWWWATVHTVVLRIRARVLAGDSLHNACVLSSKKVSVREALVDYKEPCLSERSWVMVVSALVAAPACRMAGSFEKTLWHMHSQYFGKGNCSLASIWWLGAYPELHFYTENSWHFNRYALLYINKGCFFHIQGFNNLHFKNSVVCISKIQ